MRAYLTCAQRSDVVISYRPRLYTEMERHFAFKINSTLRYNNLKSVHMCFVLDTSHTILCLVQAPKRKTSVLSALELFKQFHEISAEKQSVPSSYIAGSKLMSTIRLGSGVRRWMSGKKAPLPTRNITNIGNSPEEVKSAKSGPMTTIEAISARLLNPTVSTALATEYEECVLDSTSHMRVC